MKKRVLFVCLGNICRSPAAEGVFLHLIQSRGIEAHFEVDSAGTGNWHVGKKADSRMINAAKKRGISLPSFARQITLDDLYRFDVILTMDSANLAAVKTLALEIDSEKIAEIKPILSYARSSNSLEVPDPYYGGDDGFEIVLDLLEDACKGFLAEFS